MSSVNETYFNAPLFDRELTRNYSQYRANTLLFE